MCKWSCCLLTCNYKYINKEFGGGLQVKEGIVKISTHQILPRCSLWILNSKKVLIFIYIKHFLVFLYDIHNSFSLQKWSFAYLKIKRKVLLVSLKWWRLDLSSRISAVHQLFRFEFRNCLEQASFDCVILTQRFVKSNTSLFSFIRTFILVFFGLFFFIKIAITGFFRSPQQDGLRNLIWKN